MKKISILLVFLLVFSVFATACGGGGDESSLNSDEAVSENSEDNNSGKIRTGVDVREDSFDTVISTGASYTTSLNAGENYPDTYGTELTDGIRTIAVTDNYGDETLSGYPAAYGKFRVVLDLGYVCDKVHTLKVGYLSVTDAGVNKPSSVSVHASIDGKKWENLGILKMPEFKEGTMQEASLELKQYVNARYFRFYVQSASSWVMLDEVIVVADIEGSDSNVEYLEAVNSAYTQLGAVSRPAGTNEINRDLEKVLVSKGAKYEISGKVTERFKDNGKMLTDGVLTGFYEGQSWVGFEGGQDVTVKLDLGKNIDDIASVEASFYANTAVKLFMPVALKIATIDESGNRTELGVLYGNTVLTNGAYTYSLPLPKTIGARYIEFTMVATESTMYLVEELAVYAYRNVAKESLYPDVVLEDNATDWGSEANGEYKNLILNKTQQIITANEPSKDAYANNTGVDSTLMTDGKKATGNDIHNGSFFKFCNGGGRVVIYDLEHISAVDKFTASFTQNFEWAVKAPETVQVCVSIDGSNWYEVGTILRESEAAIIQSYELKLSKKVKARYVLFNFAVGAWVGCDEIEVFGTTSISGAAEPSKYEKKTLLANKRIEPSEELLDGAKDQVLLYQNVDRYYTVDDLIPYLAYVNEKGEQVDTMFDSFLFLFIGDFPVGGGQAHKGGTKAGWEWAVEDAFKDGQNVMALEEAAGLVKQNLGLPADYKYKVSLTLYYPSVSVTDFGDIDGDGKGENLSNLNERFKVMQWYIDLIKETFESKQFENIELVGYYWFHEAIESDDKESIQLMNKVSDMVHEKDCTFFWIPYFTANGYSAWAEYGFDVAVMQPNYVFELETPYSNVTNCAMLTKLYGMGVEMEICSDALTSINFFKKYMQYIAGGVEYGYMTDCIVMYYQGVTDFRDACNSGNIMGRMIYDATYHFIKEDLKYKPDSLANVSAEVQKNTPYAGKIEFANDNLHELAINVYPDHGSVTLSNDGTFIYYPEKDYTGEVKFSFIYSEYLGWSDPCEVTITVK